MTENARKINPNVPEIVLLTKSDGPLTKKCYLDENGALRSDSSGCFMVHGTASRISFAGVEEFGSFIGNLRSDQAISLGSLHANLPSEVGIVTKREVERANCSLPPHVVSRFANNIIFEEGRCGFVLLDHDTKGMPVPVAEWIKQVGGFWSALVSVMPDLVDIARVARASTSAGLIDRTTGASIPGSNGLHVYLQVRNVADIPRFLKTLHARFWLAGYGWFVVSASGQLLERSPVDRMVGGAERLVFEGAPVLTDLLTQDAETRRPRVTEGDTLDTLSTCPPLSVVDNAKFTELRDKAKHALAGKAAEAREKFIRDRARDRAKRTGVTVRAAEITIRKECDGVLSPSTPLTFDDAALAGKTVADVLADPAAFEGETLADPLEGVQYGPCKAKIMRRANGTLFINSFAHGGAIYELKFDADAVRAAISSADKNDAVTFLVDLLPRADVDPVEEQSLIACAAARSGAVVRDVVKQVKAARQAEAKAAKEEARERRKAERTDPRPALPVPALDAERIPVMDIINGVLAKSKDRIPPGRSIDGSLVSVRKMVIKGMHAFATDEGATGDAPPQHVIHAMSVMEAAELIEREIDFVDATGRSVCCPRIFVEHYLQRDDGALPQINAVANLPIVSADGVLIFADGLDRDRGIVFDIPQGLMDVIPRREDCNDDAVAKAMRFLLDDWLADVDTDHAGKCCLVALVLSIIERTLIDKRPAWFVTAGLSGSGKTTAIHMVMEAATGAPAAASAWSPSPEERRKALLSYFMQGAPCVLWDNIELGAQISCPHIERACTSEYYADRKLGVSETVQALASAPMVLTGNNIRPRGDLAARSLSVRINANRADPQNRNFKRPDPTGWTRSNRSRILAALYTVLLGNPMLAESRDAPMRTRFPTWYRLVGSAVEHAARCAGGELDFAGLFLEQGENNEATVDLVVMLRSLGQIFPDRIAPGGVLASPWFKAAELLKFFDGYDAGPDAVAVREFLLPASTPRSPISAVDVGRRLASYVDAIVRYDEGNLVLRSRPNSHSKINEFRVERSIDW